jgi:hypothetical protein
MIDLEGERAIELDQEMIQLLDDLDLDDNLEGQGTTTTSPFLING